MQCFAEFNDSIFFGTVDNRVMKMDVARDNIVLAPVDPSMNGDGIDFSILSAFHAMGARGGGSADGVYKRVSLIRPDFISQLAPSHSSQARYDFDTSEGTNFELAPPAVAIGGTWDLSRWDDAVWGSSQGTTFPTIGGAWGVGRYVAIATKGTSRSETRLVGWDVIYETGGPMI
jgi:hypothetical protein